mmetsp:Transcript_40731/g.84759  ORF Transcript_40731/g.84759 Transcript_40731/m.84759 type:complete len:282 (-) Transcript_40731:112-957(-)
MDFNSKQGGKIPLALFYSFFGGIVAFFFVGIFNWCFFRLFFRLIPSFFSSRIFLGGRCFILPVIGALWHTHGQHDEPGQEIAHHGHNIGRTTFVPLALIVIKDKGRVGEVAQIISHIAHHAVSVTGIGSENQKGQSLKECDNDQKAHGHAFPHFGHHFVQARCAANETGKDHSKNGSDNGGGTDKLPGGITAGIVNPFDAIVPRVHGDAIFADSNFLHLGLQLIPRTKMHVTQLKLIANQGEIIREIQGVGLKLEGSTPKGKCVGCDNGRDGANGGANEFA